MHAPNRLPPWHSRRQVGLERLQKHLDRVAVSGRSTSTISFVACAEQAHYVRDALRAEGLHATVVQDGTTSVVRVQIGKRLDRHLHAPMRAEDCDAVVDVFWNIKTSDTHM